MHLGEEYHKDEVPLSHQEVHVINVIYFWFCLGHLVRVVSARFPQYEVTIFPALYSICYK